MALKQQRDVIEEKIKNNEMKFAEKKALKE